ncbi:hypothetical protein ACNAW0_09625 [Micromonospora sp. SL1-18]|uniref:hypothetical protein n=1 Tax=Micromonospora sp. SL1-18 TaxID=3399128 RepID=UPI003A4E364F
MSRRGWAARREIDRHDWNRYRHPSGRDGSELRMIFLGLLEAGEAEEPGLSLEYRLEVQSMVFEVALPAVGVILAAYSDQLPRWVEMEFLNALHNVLLGEPHVSEIAAGNGEVVDRCIRSARSGIWVLYSKLSRHNSDFLIDILEMVDDDRGRFEFFRRSFA